MTRRVLPPEHILPKAKQVMGDFHRDLVDQVERAVAEHSVVVVGMAQNVFPKRARAALDAAQVPYHYLEYGSYLSQWRRRLALKLWTGWPTFPMIFVAGNLIGGHAELVELLASGELNRLLSAVPASGRSSRTVGVEGSVPAPQGPAPQASVSAPTNDAGPTGVAHP